MTGGGALFQLGPQVTSNQQVSIGIQSVAASKLGNSDVGFLSDIVTGGNSTLVGGQTAAASDIIEAAINQVAVLRGRLGAFQKNTLDTNIDQPERRGGKRDQQREHASATPTSPPKPPTSPGPRFCAGRHQRAVDGEQQRAERAVAACRATNVD